MLLKTPALLRAGCFALLSLPALPALSQPAVESIASDSNMMASAETPEQHAARMKWWREARFGMFIHWGLYAVPAGTWQGQQIRGIGEWIQNRGKIPVADYAKFAEQFNPVKFDAETWVKIAKAAGMKYIVITSKHHDGFALFKSNASPFNLVDATPFKRDAIMELAAACQNEGIKLGLYYSQAQDWHHRGGAASGGHWDPAAQDGDMTEYIKNVAVPQVKEILTKYGPIAVLWWDTPTDMTKERADLLAPLLKLQPGIITNNRLGGGYLGDTETPENKVPATGYPRDWEACMTMNDTWGFKSYDEKWKSTETIIRYLVDIASKGGNYLLNVGPTAEGEIPAPSVERLKQVGAWMQKNSESIYGTTASPFKRLAWGRATQKPDKLYLNVFNWPADGTLVVPMTNSARKAYLLGAPGTALTFATSPDGLRIKVPSAPVDAISSVVVIEGAGKIDPLPAPPIEAQADGSLKLSCDAADLFGPDLRVEGNTALNLGAWRSVDASAQWHAQIARPGLYEVSVLSAVPEDSNGSRYTIEIGQERLNATTDNEGTGYLERKVGTVRLEKTGAITIKITPTHIAKNEFMRLREVNLRPITAP